MITVVKQRNHSDTIYIRRGSDLGNPFAMVDESCREAVIEQFREYMLKSLKSVESDSNNVRRGLIKVFNAAKEGDVKLGCFCAPKACHGDVIKEFIEGYL